VRAHVRCMLQHACTHYYIFPNIYFFKRNNRKMKNMYITYIEIFYILHIQSMVSLSSSVFFLLDRIYGDQCTKKQRDKMMLRVGNLTSVVPLLVYVSSSNAYVCGKFFTFFCILYYFNSV